MAFRIGIQSNVGHLYGSDGAPSAGVDTLLGMMAGTSPAIAALAGGNYMFAMQANTGDLWVNNGTPQTGTDTRLGMKQGTSPAIIGLYGSSVGIAFQANTGNLFVTDGTPGNTVDMKMSMKAGTSPAIGGRLIVAFQAATGNLCFAYVGATTFTDTNLGMLVGTSPSVATPLSGQYTIAFQSNVGHLYLSGLAPNSGVDTFQGMAAGTSPSAVALPNGTLLIAFQANVGTLFVLTMPPGGAPRTSINTGFDMAVGSSPSMTVDGGVPVIAFIGRNGNLRTTQGNFTQQSDTNLGAQFGTFVTSPSIVAARGPAPAITSITPSNAPVNTRILIKGTNLVDELGAPQVYFSGPGGSLLGVGPQNISAQQIYAPVPPMAITGSITVTTLDGSAKSGLFTVDPTVAPQPPKITGMSPTQGADLTLVTLSGSNFANVNYVKMNSVNATWRAVSDTVLLAVVPNGSPGGNFVVTNDVGGVGQQPNLHSRSVHRLW